MPQYGNIFAFKDGDPRRPLWSSEVAYHWGPSAICPCSLGSAVQPGEAWARQGDSAANRLDLHLAAPGNPLRPPGPCPSAAPGSGNRARSLLLALMAGRGVRGEGFWVCVANSFSYFPILGHISPGPYWVETS